MITMFAALVAAAFGALCFAPWTLSTLGTAHFVGAILAVFAGVTIFLSLKG